jgi:hypothetical protein
VETIGRVWMYKARNVVDVNLRAISCFGLDRVDLLVCVDVFTHNVPIRCRIIYFFLKNPINCVS